MAEKVGGIEYAIDADVSGITTAGNIVQASTKRMEDSFSGVDNAVKKMQREIASTGKTITKSGNVIDSFGMINKKATESLRALTAESARLRQEQDTLAKTTKGSGKALGGLGRNAGMAGIQVQQFAGQIQGGQSALLAMSQQGADLGFVLGAPLAGAVIGIGATLVSFLIPALSGTSIETEGLIEKLEELRESGDLTKIQARELAATRQKDVDDLGKQNKAITEQIILLQKQQEKRKSAGTGISSGQFAVPLSAEQNQKRFSKAISDTEKELNTLKSQLDSNNQEIIKLNKETSDLTNGTDDSAEKMRKATASLNAQIVALESGSRAAEIYATVQRLSGTEEENQIPTLVALISKKYELADAQKAAAEVAKDAIKAAQEESKLAAKQAETMSSVLLAYQSQAAQLELNNKQLDEYNARRKLGLDDGEKIPDNIQAEIDKLEELRIKKAEMSEQAKAEKVIEQEFKTLSSGLETGGMTELERIQADFEAKRELIQEHTAILMQDDELSAQQKIDAAKNAAGLITNIEENAANARQKLAESEQASKLKAVSSAFGSLSSLMNTESKKLFEIGKAAAIAGAIVDGYAAIQGAYKVGAKLGGPPVGAAFAAASAVQTAVQVQGIAKQKVGGAQSMGATSSFSGGVPTTNTSGGGGGGMDRNISISGLDPSSMFSGEQVRDLLKNLAGDGADFTFLNA